MIPPSEAIRRLFHKSDNVISYIRPDSVGSCNKTHINNLEKLHVRAGPIVYGLPQGTSAEEVLKRTGWDSLETIFKLRLTEFFFKCIKGYLKSLFTEEFRPQKK